MDNANVILLVIALVAAIAGLFGITIFCLIAVGVRSRKGNA